MKIFVTAFKNTISRLKSRLTPFSLLLLCSMTILSFVVPINTTTGTPQQAFSVIISAILVLPATIFLVEYLGSLEILMWKTAFKERSILNIFVKYSDPKNHVYANLSTIVMISLVIIIFAVALTHVLLPIMFALILVAMVTMISTP